MAIFEIFGHFGILENILFSTSKEYKNVSKKEKGEIKNNYELEKTKKEVYEEETQKLEKWYLLNIYQF